ncbi:diguanylate cyclase regulator RdcB family protein [Escherichia coli]
MNPSDAIEAIEKPLSSLPYSLSRHILEHLRKLTSHEPVIGIMGKSGAGKSSLCNALFQGEVTPVSDVHAGTREVRRFRLADQVHHKLNHLEEKLHRVDQVQRAQLHLEQIFSWWSAGRYASFSPAGRCYVALEELRWGAFGDVIRQGETGQVNQLLDILRHKALTQMAQESGGSATVRLNTLDWLGGQGREQADNEWHDAINWLGDWCSEEQHPVIWSTTQAAEHLPVRMPRLCSAERLSESMVDEIFQKGAA